MKKFLISLVLILSLFAMGIDFTPNLVVKGAPWYDVRGYSSLSTALTAIGASTKTLYITADTAVATDITIPSNVQVTVFGSGKFTIANTKVLTIQGNISAGTHTIFVGPGTVAASQAIKAEWLGGLVNANALLGANAHVLTVETTQALSANLTLPATMDVQFIGTGNVSVTAGKTFTISGHVSGDRQIFSGNGVALPSGLQPCNVMWWPSLAKAVTDLSTNVRTLKISSATAVSGTSTIPANICLDFDAGGSLTLAGGTETTLGKIKAGRYQIFTGTGLITWSVGQNEKVFPEWFGTDPTATVDSGAAFQAAIDSIKRSNLLIPDLAPPDAIGFKNFNQLTLQNAPGGQYFSTIGLFLGQTLDAADKGLYFWDGNASSITFKMTGGICLDYTGKHQAILKDLAIVGDLTDIPAVGVLLSRNSALSGNSAGQHHWEQVGVYGKFSEIGVVNYASEGWHVINCNFRVDAPITISITKSNYGVNGTPTTIPNDDPSNPMTGAPAMSNIEYLFQRCNIFNNQEAGTSHPVYDSALQLEAANNVLIDHCEIGANKVHDIPLVRLVSGFGGAGYLCTDIVMNNVTFHPTGAPVTGYDIAVQFTNANPGGNAYFRGINLANTLWTGNKYTAAPVPPADNTTADLKADASCIVYNLKVASVARVDFSAAGCSLMENCEIHLPPFSATNNQSFSINDDLQGLIYYHSTSNMTITTPAKDHSFKYMYDAGSVSFETGGAGSYTGSYTLTGDESVSGDLAVGTDLTVGGNATVTGDVSAADIAASGTLTVAGATALAGATADSFGFTTMLNSSHNYGGAAVDWTISTTEVKSGVFHGSNASGDVIAILPANTVKFFLVHNLTGYHMTLKYGGSTGVEVDNGKQSLVFADGSEVRRVIATDW